MRLGLFSINWRGRAYGDTNEKEFQEQASKANMVGGTTVADERCKQVRGEHVKIMDGSVVEIITVQEEDGRWLAYCHSPRVLSYGATKEDAIISTRQCVEELGEHIERLNEGFAIPHMEDGEMVGMEMMKVVADWMGVSPEDLLKGVDDFDKD